LVEAAGVEPASEAASSRTSTSVSGILVLAWRLLPTGSASASHGDGPTSRPRRPWDGDPVYVTSLLGSPEKPRAAPGINVPGLQSLLLTQRGRKRWSCWRL